MKLRLYPETSSRGIGLALLRVLIVVYVLFCFVIFFRQDAMLYFPDYTSFTDCPAFSDAEFLSAEGTRAYYVQNGTSSRLAVFYHGNAGRACDRAFYRSALESAGYSMLFVEYEGYAGDGLIPKTEAVLSDVRHVVDWITTKRQYMSIAVIGESIGTGAASFHASLAFVDKLILLAPFDRLSHVASDMYPFYPITLMLRRDYDNVSWARNAKSVLIFHGTNDEIIPMRYGKNLYNALPQRDKHFITLEGYDHNSLFGAGVVLRAIRQYLSAESIPISLE